MYVLNNLEEEVHYKRPLTTDYRVQEDRWRQITAFKKRRKIQTTRRKQQTEAEQAKGLWGKLSVCLSIWFRAMHYIG